MTLPTERTPANIAGSEPAASVAPSTKPARAWDLVVLAVAVAAGAAGGWLLPIAGGSPGPAATALAVRPAAPGPAGVEPAAGPLPR